MKRRAPILVVAVAIWATFSLPSGASAAEPCALAPQSRCFGVESVQASLSTTQAGAHPDFTFKVGIKQDPETKPNPFGLQDSYGPTRNIRFNLPPGLIGDPNVLGAPQQCTMQELFGEVPGDECPNGSQIGVATIAAYQLSSKFREPVYMMQPPGGNVVARLGTVAGIYPTLIDLQVRSEGDYGLVAEVHEAPAAAKLIELETTLWGVPADPAHDNERCTSKEAFSGCVTSPARPPGSRVLPFLTNPTRCGVPLEMGVNASNWAEAELDPAKEVKTTLGTISGCNQLPFGPSLSIAPTSRRAGAPTGSDVTIKLPKADGVEVLEPAQMRSIRVALPQGVSFNPGAADGLGTCSAAQVRYGERVAAECPNSAKLADTEFDVPVLERKLKGAIYLREPEPGNLFRIWITADDLGLHVKLQGQLEVDKQTGQITAVTTELPQAPVREAKLEFKSGFRAPLLNPPACGEYQTEYEFISWAGGPPVTGKSPMTISEGCETGGFSPALSAGTTDSTGGRAAPFVFRLTRQDGEQNPQSFDVSLPTGLVADFSGIPRCEGVSAETGSCPAASRIGKTVVADGAGPAPLWVPQPGKDPTAVYLGGPYKGAPISIIAVVPAQAGPFDLGVEVVRSAVYVDPVTARATAKTDPLPQIIEGIPIIYRTIDVELDRPGFTQNPTSCAAKATTATLISVGGKVATASAPFAATNCAKLPFKPSLSLRLKGGTKRSGHPALISRVTMPAGGANIGSASVALPHALFLDQGSLNRVCTRVQFAAEQCPAGSIYGHAVAHTPLFDFPLEGNVYLGTGYGHKLPDVVAQLKGPPSFPVEIDLNGRVDELNEGIRTTFDTVPDAPVSEFTLSLHGGKTGLLENSTNLCLKKRLATAVFTAQNGMRRETHPSLRVRCARKGGRRSRR